jgi:hypothetical protein
MVLDDVGTTDHGLDDANEVPICDEYLWKGHTVEVPWVHNAKNETKFRKGKIVCCK